MPSTTSPSSPPHPEDLGLSFDLPPPSAYPPPSNDGSLVNDLHSGFRQPRQSFVPLSWRALFTGEELPPSDVAIVQECRRKIIFRALVGGALLGGLVGGITYGRGLMTPWRRFVTTSSTGLYGAALGAATVSPWFLKTVRESTDPESVLRRDLRRVVQQHNPNRTEEVKQRMRENMDRQERNKGEGR